MMDVRPVLFRLVWVCNLSACGLLPAPLALADDVLVAQGSEWRYLDDGSDQGTAWRGNGFDDSTWPSGAAELGYGDLDEVTVVGFGLDISNKFITTYFRHEFPVVNPADYLALGLRLKRDDGAVVHLNGVELRRDNMPPGAVGNTTLALAGVGGADESTFFEFVVPTTDLVAGTNVLAVEIHQFAPDSSDISFDLELTGVTAISRGPYLQMGTPESVVVRWRTLVPTNSRVQFGLAPGVLSSSMDELTLTTEHEVELTGLLPATQYFYSVGTTTSVLAGGDADHYFKTSPAVGDAPPMRVWVIGDSGTANANARSVRDQYLAVNAGGHTDVWLMLGDNAYFSGTDAQYQAAVFDTYPTILRNTVVWPTLGNHDAETAGVSQSSGTGPYFDMFTLPGVAEAGGVASGTEAYYSFDYGNVHFINLNSTGSDRSPGSPMLQWLEADLAATDKDWILAYWHHPPYSKGSHDSDDSSDSGGRMFDMRENVLPILEAGGVDLVLSGHSHSYERSYLIDSHYGVSTTFSESMKVDGGDGREDGDGAYRKQPRGTVYAVAGSSGLTSGGSLDHPVMFVSFNLLGSMLLDIDGGRLDAFFLTGSGVADAFTLLKSPECDLEVSQASYVPGEALEITRLRLRNPGPEYESVEWKLWLQIGPQTRSLVSSGDDGSLVFPPGLDLDPDPFVLLPDVAVLPAGSYNLGCRLLDPVTGQSLSEDVDQFQVNIP